MPAWNLYDPFRQNSFNGGAIDFDTDQIYLMFVTNSYVPNQNTHDFRDDLGANEVSGTGYTAGGQQLDNITVTMDGSGNVKVDTDDETFLQNAAGFTNARYAIVYKRLGGAASADRLIAYGNLASDKGTVAGDLIIQQDAAGFITSAR